MKNREREEIVERTMLNNWIDKNGGIGIKRKKLREMVNEKSYYKNKVIAKMRKKGIIRMERWRYFIDKSTINFIKAQRGMNI